MYHSLFLQRLRKVSASTGIITTVVGNGGTTPITDNVAATSAGVETPLGVTFDSDNNLYVVSVNGKRVRVVNTSGYIRTFAGGGSGGLGDGGQATSATFTEPNDIVYMPSNPADGSPYIFVSDASK